MPRSVYFDDVARGLGGSQVSVTSPTGLLAAINAAQGTGKTLVLDPGKVFTLDATALSAGANPNFSVSGSGSGLLDWTGAKTAAQLEVGQSVIQLTNLDSVANTHTFQDTFWEKVVFDLSLINANNKHFLFGSNNVRNRFERTSLLNPSCVFEVAHGLGLELSAHRIVTSSDVATLVPGGTFGSWMCPQSLVARDVIVDGVYNTAGNASPFGVNIYGAQTVGVTYQPWMFDNCWFFPSNTNGVDAAIDLEFGRATRGPPTTVSGGWMFDSKIYFVHVPKLTICNGFIHRITSVSGTGGIGGPMVVDNGSTGTADGGELTIDESVLDWADDNAGLAGATSVKLTNLTQIQRLNLKHRFICNGASTNGTPIPFQITAPAGAASQWIDDLEMDVRLSYTSLPGTPTSSIALDSAGAVTYGKSRVALTYLGAQAAAGGLPAAVGGGVCTIPVSLGPGGHATTFDDIALTIDARKVAPTTPTASAPRLYTPGGSAVANRLFYDQSRMQSLVNDSGLISSTPGPTTTTVLQYTPLSAGLFEVGGYLDVTAFTSGIIAFQLTTTDSDSTANAAQAQRASVAASGTSAINLAATGGLYVPTYSINAKAGSPITCALNQSLVSTARLRPFIRQVA